MFKNKKVSQNVENSDETFSLTSVDIPVMRESATSDTPVMRESTTSKEAIIPNNEKDIKGKKEKNDNGNKGPNVLWAKIAIAVIVGFVSVLSVYKYMDDQKTPGILFGSLLDSLREDSISILNTIGSDNLFNVLSMETYEMSIDSKVSASDFGEDEAHLQEVVNALKYVSNVKVNRTAGTVNANVRATKDNVEKFTFSYIENDKRKYINVPLMRDQYIELNNTFDMIKFSPELGKRVVDLIKSQVVTLMEGSKFSSSDESVTVNGKTFGCVKSTYTLSNGDMNSFVDKIYNSIKGDSVSYTFLAYMFGQDAHGLDVKFEELKNKLGLSSSQVYELSAFTTKEDKEGVRLELKFTDKSEGGDVEKTISYNKDYNFIGFEVKSGDVIESLTIKGSLEGTFTINEISLGNVTNLTLRPKENGKEGALSVVGRDSNEPKIEASFSYDLESVSNNSYSIDVDVEVKDYSLNDGATYKIDSSIIVEGKNSVEGPPEITNPIKYGAYLEEVDSTLEDKFKGMLREISIADIQPPQVFTPENSGEIPSQE